MRLQYNLLLLAAASVFSLPIVSKVALLAIDDIATIRNDGEHKDTYILEEDGASKADSHKPDASNSSSSGSSTLTPSKSESSESLPNKSRPRKQRPSRIEIREPEPAPLQCTTPPCDDEEDPFESSMSPELL